MQELLASYPDVVDSGHGWLGAVPSHWPCLPNRAVFREIVSQGHVDEKLLSVTIARGVIPQAELLSSTSKKDSSNLDKSKYKLVEPGDVVYNKMRAWQGAIGLSLHRGIVSPAYIVQRLRASGEPRFFHYLFRTPAFASEAERWSYGITSDQWSLRPEHFKMIYSCVPPIEEQAAIVRYLDHLEHKVVGFIRAKLRLIEVLREQRSAIVSRAVTIGYEADGKFKPSGAEWLGDIPEHWSVSPLKYLSPHVTVGIVVQPAALYEPVGIPCLRSLNISSGRVDPTDLVYISAESNEAHSKSKLFDGDVVVVRTGQAGVAVVVPPEFDGANAIDLLIVRAAPEIDSHYLALYLNSSVTRTQVRYMSVGAIQAHYNTATLANLLVAFPAIDEQRRTLRRVAKETGTIDAAIARAEREIELLSLIHI